MKRDDLIKKLQELPDGAEICVWEGYNAGCVEDNFDIVRNPERENVYTLESGY